MVKIRILHSFLEMPSLFAYPPSAALLGHFNIGLLYSNQTLFRRIYAAGQYIISSPPRQICPENKIDSRLSGFLQADSTVWR